MTADDAQRVEFFFVDVFADRPLTGNPLTLVPDADALDVGQMRAIAREFNQSETTFLVRPTGAAHIRLRSFTPAGFEVGGAGHNALGAWLWLAFAGRVGPGEYVQEIGDELLHLAVSLRSDGRPQVAMVQNAPTFGSVVAHDSELAAALGVPVDDLDHARSAQVVSTGVGHLLVPVRDAAVVDRLAPDRAALRDVLHAAGGEGCYAYTADAPDGADAYARFFNPTVGIAEDPATGTAAGPLAAALVAGDPAGRDIVIEQGHALGRPSRLVVHVDGGLVRLTGSGLVVGSGRLLV